MLPFLSFPKKSVSPGRLGRIYLSMRSDKARATAVDRRRNPDPAERLLGRLDLPLTALEVEPVALRPSAAAVTARMNRSRLGYLDHAAATRLGSDESNAADSRGPPPAQGADVGLPGRRWPPRSE